MKESKIKEKMSELMNDPAEVAATIVDVFDEELLQLFHVKHSVAFHKLLKSRVEAETRKWILRDESNA